MPEPKKSDKHLGAECRAKLAMLRQGPDDFSDYHEYGCSSPRHLQGVIESIERRLRGEERTYPPEEVIAELELEDAARVANPQAD